MQSEACFSIFIQGSKHVKWKSSLDLTEREKEKAKKKRKRSLIHQGLLDLINIGDVAVSGDNTNLKTFAAVNKTHNRAEGNKNGTRDSKEVPGLPPGKKIMEVLLDENIDKIYT